MASGGQRIEALETGVTELCRTGLINETGDKNLAKAVDTQNASRPLSPRQHTWDHASLHGLSSLSSASTADVMHTDVIHAGATISFIIHAPNS